MASPQNRKEGRLSLSGKTTMALSELTGIPHQSKGNANTQKFLYN